MFQLNVIYNKRQRLGFGPWAIVCCPWLEIKQSNPYPRKHLQDFKPTVPWLHGQRAGIRNQNQAWFQHLEDRKEVTFWFMVCHLLDGNRSTRLSCVRRLLQDWRDHEYGRVHCAVGAAQITRYDYPFYVVVLDGSLSMILNYIVIPTFHFSSKRWKANFHSLSTFAYLPGRVVKGSRGWHVSSCLINQVFLSQF